jgi:hypothetical protein
VETFKLLFISFTITFLVLLNISPAIAKPLVSITQLKVSNDIKNRQASYDITLISKTTKIDLTNNDINNFSSSLVFASPRILNEQRLNSTMDFFNTSTTFFTSIMLINDKLHQLISYFSKPNDIKIIDNETTEQDTKLIKEKCNSNLNFG